MNCIMRFLFESGDTMKQMKKQYYLNFFNNQLLRDFRFIINNPNLKNNVKIPYLPYDADFDFKKEIMKFILKNTNKYNKIFGALTGQVTYYKTIGDLREKSESKRYANCLFFDFDSDDVELHDLKNEIRIAYKDDDLKGKALFSKIHEIQKDYQDLLFSSNILDEPFSDAKKLYDYFKSIGINSYPIFSGSKGVHLYIFFNECNLINYSEISYKLAESYKKHLDLKTLDLAVNKDALSRVSRVPYSNHETSNLFSTPFDFDSDSIADILESSRKQEYKEFNLKDYVISDASFTATLKETDKVISDYNLRIIKEKKKLNPINKHSNIINKNISNTDELFSDMRVLLKVIIPDNYVKSFKRYDSYLCPFHDDNSPSARVYSGNFYCEADNLHLNYFEFLRKFYDLKSDDEVKKKMSELKSELKT